MGEDSDGSSASPSPSLGNATFSQLLAARDSLHKGLEKSRNLGDALEKAGSRLQRISRRIPQLQAAIDPLRSHKKVLHDLGTHIDKAIGPAVAVLKVFDAVHGLERSLLSDSSLDIGDYICLICRLEEALSFLSQNCNVAIEWLQDMVVFLEQNHVLEGGGMVKLSSKLEALKAWQASKERTKLDGGLLDAALDRLEVEFKRVLTEFSVPVPIPASAVPYKGESGNAAPFLPGSAVKELQMIVERLAAHHRTSRCMDLYIDIRSKVAKASMQPLQLDYLHSELGSKLQWKALEKYVGPWTQHVEVVVKLIFEPEYQLCSQVFEKLGSEECGECFGRIAVSGGMIEFLQFGETVARSRNEPQKLFKLLEMFEAMNNLRPSFTKVFGGMGCKEVQQRTRDLLKQVVQVAHDIFLELKQQVELQKDTEPPMDATVPRVSSFVVGYVKHLVGDFYGPIITQVLAIEQSWREGGGGGGKIVDGLLSKAVRRIMQALVQNFYEWAKCFKDQGPLFHLFLMNNFWYIYVSCKETQLKLLVGEAWLREQQQQAEQQAALYVKEGWGKAMQQLNIEGELIVTASRAAAREVIKGRLRKFNEAFEVLYERHAKWSILDAELREKTCMKVTKAVVPAYRSYIQRYGPLMEQHQSRNSSSSSSSSSKYAKYTAQSLERMLGSLFHGRPEKLIVANKIISSGSNAIARTPAAAVVKVI